jgi:hypothetical protein
MSDDDDWDFAGDADAKVTITLRFDIYSSVPPAAAGATLLLRSSGSCAKPRSARHPILLMMRRAADGGTKAGHIKSPALGMGQDGAHLGYATR